VYDAIVVGARVAGAPTAMLLARSGYDVLLLDKSSFPSDIMSTHYIHPPGVLRLQRWGLLDKLLATGCPPITDIQFEIEGAPFSPPAPQEPQDTSPDALPGLCPRRTVLDKLLVDAAVEAGVELRENFSVKEILMDGDAVTGIRGAPKGGDEVTEEAKFVIGADGFHSTVAQAVNAEEYNAKPSMSFAYYAYWSGYEPRACELHFREDGGVLSFPTNDGLQCVAVGGPDEMFHEFRKDIEGNYMRILNAIPSVAEKMKHAKQEERFIGTNDQPNFFRKPFGPGWALVGDAGYHRDFVTGLGITDAFRDAEFLAEALDDGFSGRKPIDEALAEYQRKRDEIAEPLYELTTQMVSGEPPTAEQFIKFGLAMQSMMPEGTSGTVSQAQAGG
jgi:flavin-dependent dehydrogenase